MAQQTLAEYAKELRASLSPALVDIKTHMPSPNELNNMMYLPFKYILGVGVRTCDIMLVASQTMGRPVTEVNLVIADLMWDHFMGEPEEPSLADVEEAVLVLAEQLFSCEKDVRENIG